MNRLIPVCLLACMLSGELVASQLPEPQRSPSFLPMGVYWPGELLWKDALGGLDWTRIDASLDDLAARKVNAIWLTHRSPSDTAAFARRAAKRGIFLIASIAELAGEVPHIRTGNHQELINRVIKEWGDAPKPIAWGLGDEPVTAYMDEMAGYVANWRKYAPGEPVTTVVMHGDMKAASALKFDTLSADIYPFFSSGNPNAFGMPSHQAWTSLASYLTALNPRSMMMGQAYQEPNGPHDIDAKGNVIYLPGGAPHWIAPSPAQIRWQALSAFALGCKGMFYFSYIFPSSPAPQAAPSPLPAAVAERTDSGVPHGMIYADGSPSRHIVAMGEAYSWLAAHATTLAKLTPATTMEAWEVQPTRIGGNVVSMLCEAATKRRWLMVVASYDLPPNSTVRFGVGPHIRSVKADGAVNAPRLSGTGPFRYGEVILAAGSAALFECVTDASNLPVGYRDDFLSDRFTTDAIEVHQVVRHGDHILSASGHQDPGDAFIIYDLEKWLPPLPAAGTRMLYYDGFANPPDMRGAFWSSSSDGKTWSTLSSNEFGIPVQVRDRYLKLGLCWKQSGGPWPYGCLASFTAVQWAKGFTP